MAVIIFAKKILSTRSPKLRLLCWLVLEVKHKCCLVLARWVFRLWEIVIMETQGSLSSRRSQMLNTPSSENWCRTKVKVFIGNDTVYKAASGNLRNSIGISFCHKVCHFFNRVRNWNLSRGKGHSLLIIIEKKLTKFTLHSFNESFLYFCIFKTWRVAYFSLSGPSEPSHSWRWRTGTIQETGGGNWE